MPTKSSPQNAARPKTASEKAEAGPKLIPTPSGTVQRYIVPPFAAGLRLDSFLSRVVGNRTRSQWHLLIGAGAIKVPGREVKASLRVAAGDRVEILDVPRHLALEPQAELELNIAYCDEGMVVIDKPPNMVVHPSPGHDSGTLINALLARFPEMRDPTGSIRPGIVHRLDKDTSGLMVVGRTPPAMVRLQDQFRDRMAAKTYYLLVHGAITEDRGIINAPIRRSPVDRQKMAVGAGGKTAETSFRVKERFRDFTLVEADLHSGRTHQLRVHFSYIGHPVAGDKRYGSGKAPPGLQRQFLHSCFLRIGSPVDGRTLEFRSPLPPDLEAVLAALRREQGRGL